MCVYIYSSNVYHYCDGYHHPCYYAGNCMMNPSYYCSYCKCYHAAGGGGGDCFDTQRFQQSASMNLVPGNSNNHPIYDWALIYPSWHPRILRPQPSQLHTNPNNHHPQGQDLAQFTAKLRQFLNGSLSLNLFVTMFLVSCTKSITVSSPGLGIGQAPRALPMQLLHGKGHGSTGGAAAVQTTQGEG